MQNVAAYAGVSIATVSKVMQGDPTVRPDNVVAVQNAIEALGYRINPVAAELRRGRRKLIGVVVDCLDRVTTALVRSIERHAETNGYAIWVECSDGSDQRESMLIGRLQNWRVAGFILLRVHDRSPGPTLLLENAAAVMLDSPEAPAGFDSVSASFDAAARQLALRLGRTGHRKLLVLAPRQMNRRSERLQAGLFKVLEQSDDIRVTCLRLDAEPLTAGGQLGACLGASSRPTAVVILEPSLDMLVTSYAIGRGWSIPSDLLVVSLRAAGAPGKQSACLPGLEYPADDMAAKAVELVLQRIEHPRKSPSAVQEPYVLGEWSEARTANQHE